MSDHTANDGIDYEALAKAAYDRSRPNVAWEKAPEGMRYSYLRSTKAVVAALMDQLRAQGMVVVRRDDLLAISDPGSPAMWDAWRSISAALAAPEPERVLVKIPMVYVCPLCSGWKERYGKPCELCKGAGEMAGTRDAWMAAPEPVADE